MRIASIRKRHAITLSKTCLVGKPLQLIPGSGNDFEAECTCSDSIYGDSRFVADAYTGDISSFRPLREGNDKGFCDFVHLMKRNYKSSFFYEVSLYRKINLSQCTGQGEF